MQQTLKTASSDEELSFKQRPGAIWSLEGLSFLVLDWAGRAQVILGFWARKVCTKRLARAKGNISLDESRARGSRVACCRHRVLYEFPGFGPENWMSPEGDILALPI